MLSLGLCLLLCQGTSFDHIDVTRFAVFPLEGLTSPTSLLHTPRGLFAGADTLAARSGMYRVWRHRDGHYQATLVSMLPMQDVICLNPGPENRIHAMSARWFGPDREQWRSQAITLEPQRFRVEQIDVIQVPILCANGQYDCGMTAWFPLPDGKRLAFSRQKPPRLHILEKEGEFWESKSSALITLNRRYPVITEVRDQGNGTFLFLLRDKWMIAGANLADAVKNPPNTIGLKPVFDLGPLKTQFAISHLATSFGGLAEGFSFDAAGNLWLLLNNRGYAFTKSPDNLLDDRPKLLFFPANKESLQK